jgi:Putative MetA-pathway of phenol degradation
MGIFPRAGDVYSALFRRGVFGMLAAMLCFNLAASAQAETPICADRPTKSNNVCAVDPGAWQLETDLFNATFQRAGGVTTDTYLLTNPTLKYGLAENWDIEANLAPYEIVRTRGPGGASQTLSGLGDLFLRVKVAALPEGPVQLGFIPYVKLPTAREGIGNGAVEAGVSVPVNITLSGVWSLGFSPEFDALEDASGGGRHFNTSQTVVVGYALPGDVTLNAELWGDWNADPAGTVRQYSADFGVAKLLTKTFQIDGGVNFGLNRATPDVQLYAGLATKF